MLWYVLAGLFTFASAAAGDWLETRHIQAVNREDRQRAEQLSVAMYLVSVSSLVVMIKMGLWVIACEVVGLIVGTRLAFRRR